MIPVLSEPEAVAKSMREVQASGDANFNILLDSDTVSFEGLDPLWEALNYGDQQDGVRETDEDVLLETLTLRGGP